MFRSTMFACAAAMMAMTAAPSFAEPQPAPRCEEMSFRIYFGHGSAALDEAALDMLAAAERNVAACGYAELRMSMDASSPEARARSEAIMAATDGRAWDAVRVEWSPMLQRAAMRSGPDFVEVTMSPEPMAPVQLEARREAGV